MIGVTAILHTYNDALRIARAVESLRCCNEVLVIDHNSSDDTSAVARAFGARVVAGVARGKGFHWPGEAANDWIFCLQPTETVTETLEASLLEWKLAETQRYTGLAVAILEEGPEGWIPHPPETRLVHRSHTRWDGWTPITEGHVGLLDGSLARLLLP